MKKFLSLLLALSLALSLYVPVFAADGVLTDGDNTIELPWDTDEAVTYTYTATQTGTLYISALEFYYSDGDFDYIDNMDNMDEWEMYTELTVDGQLLDGLYYGSVEVVEGQTYTFTWTHLYATQKWYNLGWKAVLSLSYSGENVPQPGSQEMPVELFTADCPTDSIEIPAGGTVWYLLHDFGGAEFTITGENAYVALRAYNQETADFEELEIDAVDGVVTVSIGSYYTTLQIGNRGEEPAVFGLNYQYPLGTEHNPDTLKLGTNVVTVQPENYEGYTLTWTAQCDGVLTLTLPEENWMVSVLNVQKDRYAQWYDSLGENVITVEVSAGDEILINVNYIDEKTYGFPGGDVTVEASVAYAHEYVDGVCVHCGAEEENQGPEEPVTVGDVNGDGRINARDARTLLRLVAGLTNEGEANEAAADVNNDGRVNARDARTLLRQIAGLE
jgi:hypothetical protein